MKRAVLGAFAGVGLVMAAVAVAQQHGEPFPRTAFPANLPAATAPAVAGSELIVVPMGDKGLIVIDPRQRAIAVYHIDPASGKIVLKSARNIQWDLQIMDFNNENPVPQQIRSSLEQK